MGKHFPVFVTSNKEVVQPNDRVECVVILSDVLHTFGRNGNNGQLCNFFYCLQMRDRTLYSADRMFPCAHGFNGIVEFLQALPLGDAAIVDLLASIADVDIFGYWPTAKVFSEVNRALLKAVFSYRAQLLVWPMWSRQILFIIWRRAA